MDHLDSGRRNSRGNDTLGHALLAIGIIVLVILSIIIAWLIVCCERHRRKRKYRPGQQRRRDPLAGGTIIRHGPSPQINRHLLVPNRSPHHRNEHLVIANKAFLSKSTPELVLDEEDDQWRMEALSVASDYTPSEPLVRGRRVQIVGSSSSGIGTSTGRKSSSPRKKVVTTAQVSVRRSKSESWMNVDQKKGSDKELNIHQQIAAILGTFPQLDFTSFVTPTRAKPTQPYTSLPSTFAKRPTSTSRPGKVDSIVEPESLVDDEVLMSVDVDLEENTPLTGASSSSTKRPTSLMFNNKSKASPAKQNNIDTRKHTVQGVRYDFDVEKGLQNEEEDDDMPPLMETTL